jgi:hypothetical protein
MIFHKPHPRKYKPKEVTAQLSLLKNQSCIYFKNPSICLSRLGEYALDNTGLELTLYCQTAKGLNQLSPQMELYCSLEDFSITRKHLVCYDEGWHLFFDENLIEGVLSIAGNNEDNDDRLLEIMDLILGFLVNGNTR